MQQSDFALARYIILMFTFSPPSRFSISCPLSPTCLSSFHLISFRPSSCQYPPLSPLNCFPFIVSLPVFLLHHSLCLPIMSSWLLPTLPFLAPTAPPLPSLTSRSSLNRCLFLMAFFFRCFDFFFYPLCCFVWFFPSTTEPPHLCHLSVLPIPCLFSAHGGLPPTPAAGVPRPAPARNGHRGQAHQAACQLLWGWDPKDGRLPLWGGH